MQKIGFCDKYLLTQAVLNGTKTMTRRVEKGLETFEIDYQIQFIYSLKIINQYWDEEKNSLAIITPQGKMKVPTRYKLGEVVAVAQAYKDVFIDDDLAIFDDGLELKLSKGWNNKLFVKPDLMPHQIQITGVRIERLQAITDDDVYKEGFTHEDINNNWGNAAWHWEAVLVYYDRLGRTKTIQDRDPREAFAALIDRPGVGRKGLWESNPWVVVYEFKLIK